MMLVLSTVVPLIINALTTVNTAETSPYSLQSKQVSFTLLYSPMSGSKTLGIHLLPHKGSYRAESRRFSHIFVFQVLYLLICVWFKMYNINIDLVTNMNTTRLNGFHQIV